MKDNKLYLVRVIYKDMILSMGTGDLELVNEFNTLKEARECFNKIKKDKNGFSNFRQSDTLETWILKENDWDNPIDVYYY